MALVDDEGVALGDGETVPDGEGVVGLGDDPVGFKVTERTVVIHVSSLRDGMQVRQ